MRYPSGQKLGGRVLRVLGLDRFFPEGIFAKLDKPSHDIVVSRVPAGRTHGPTGEKDRPR